MHYKKTKNTIIIISSFGIYIHKNKGINEFILKQFIPYNHKTL